MHTGINQPALVAGHLLQQSSQLAAVWHANMRRGTWHSITGLIPVVCLLLEPVAWVTSQGLTVPLYNAPCGWQLKC